MKIYNRHNIWRRPVLRFVFLWLIAALPYQSLADPTIMIRNNDENGNYVIETWDGNCNDGCKLRESSDFGSTWTVIASDNNVPSLPPVVISNKPNGTYQYELEIKEIDYDEQEIILDYSEIQEVIVGPVASPPTLADQLTYDYEIRVGDINTDGRQDLYLDRVTVAPANNGTLKTVMLKQLANGSFEVIIPNATQKNAASLWPLTGIDVILSDVNLDGFTDLRLLDVDSSISGAQDQIVYSPAVAYTDISRNVKAVDASFENFAGDMIGYYLDEDYFTDRAEQVYEPGDWEEMWDCELDWRGIQGWEFVCATDYQWEPGHVDIEYEDVHPDSVIIWEDAVAASTGQESWEAVVETLERMLEVDIQIDTWCITIGIGSGDECQTTGISHVILAILALSDHGNAPKGRSLNTVYLTAHRIVFPNHGPLHSALEYSRNVNGAKLKTVLSAASSGIGSFGTLDKEINRSTDLNNFTVTTVTSTVEPNPTYHWDSIFDAHLTYRNDCIPYEAAPPWVGGPSFPQGEHNSNSYIAGLIEVTNSVLAEGSMHDFILGENPVPNVYYTTSTPCGYP